MIRMHGGFEQYGGRECNFAMAEQGHVFDEQGNYPICECGSRKKAGLCECGQNHKLIESNEAERLNHELLRIHFRLLRLEQPQLFSNEETKADEAIG